MKQNIVKILIPLIAVVVIIESIVIVFNLNKSVSQSKANNFSLNLEEVVETEIDQPVVNFNFETETKEMKVGKSYEVKLVLVGTKEVNLDAIETYLKYDSTKLAISKLTSNKELPKMTKNSGIDSKSGMISSIFLWDVNKYYSVKTADIIPVLSFMVTPKVDGEMTINLITNSGNNSGITMIVENNTSKSLPFLSNDLKISVIK